MSRIDRIAAAAKRYIDNKTFAGIEWLIERRGEELARGQCGYADPASKRPIPKNALYRIYSMTKPITSVMALILIEQGKLRLYDMLPQFDKRFAQMTVLSASGQIAPAQRPITVEDLLTHRAGFTYEFIPGCQIAQYYQAAKISSDGTISLDEMMGRLAEQPIAFQPGTQFRYSVATDVLAHVIEKAAGRGIDELMKEYIFDPLGMNDTAYFVPAEKRDRLDADVRHHRHHQTRAAETARAGADAGRRRRHVSVEPAGQVPARRPRPVLDPRRLHTIRAYVVEW